MGEIELHLAIAGLPLAEKQKLCTWLGEIIAAELVADEPLEIPVKSNREVVEQRRVGSVVYQLELVRCGKPTCKCAGPAGKKHGPYWYSYQRNNKRVVSKYLGKHLSLLM